MNKSGNLKQLYQKNSVIHLPVYNITRSKSYYNTLALIKNSRQWSKEETDKWIINSIKEIVNYAIENVPYYKDLYKTIGLVSGNDIKSFSDFEKLPTVSKEIIKDNYEAFYSSDKSLSRKEFCTSGTSMPFRFFLDKEYVGREQAFFDYYWNTRGGGV